MLRQGSFLFRPQGSILFRPKGSVPRARRGQSHAPFPLYNKYGDKLQIIAVSLDSAEKPWRKAMNEELMEWTQLWADKAHVSGISEPYQVHSIPYIMLLNPEGRIIYAGHDPDAVSLLLEKELH